VIIASQSSLESIFGLSFLGRKPDLQRHDPRLLTKVLFAPKHSQVVALPND
jgi:hypothetical protein